MNAFFYNSVNDEYQDLVDVNDGRVECISSDISKDVQIVYNTENNPNLSGWGECNNFVKTIKLTLDNNLKHSISNKLYIMKLLAGMKYSEYHKNYPTEKMLENFQSTDSWIDELICELAGLADTKFLKNIFGLLNEENIFFKFKPTHNPRYDEILTWLNQNISKGRSNRGSQLGWQSGPCSARWPSTNLIDYENTLSMLIPYLI
ncbi:hypothetical protein FQR65_LT16343 [Abscondita terminalis]|nr:hypothetical protein FQR65_LT16343 [Abscondita terminalis]